MRHQAIYELYDNVVRIDDVHGPFDQNGISVNIDETLVNAKIEELSSIKSLELLRIKRNRLLSETDWTQNRDVSLRKDSDWQTYRQSLRDLPSTASPELDENGQLSNVTWPTKPE